jgi:predicted dehydrogenase
MFRYMPAVDRVRELLDGQRVIHVNSEYFCPALTKWKLADWFRLKEKSGGPVIDQAIHLFDLVRYLAGEITEVMAFETNVVRPKDDACTIEDSSSTILRFENGATGAHLQSWVHDQEEGLVTVRTERDRLTLDTTGNLSGRVDGKPVSFEVPAALADKNFPPPGNGNIHGSRPHGRLQPDPQSLRGCAAFASGVRGGQPVNGHQPNRQRGTQLRWPRHRIGWGWSARAAALRK